MRHLTALLLLFSGGTVSGQTFAGAGSMSGSGLVLLPSAAATPASQFRLHATRLEYLSPAAGGANVMVLTSGLSSHLEAYVRIVAEQPSAGSSVLAPGFGGKLLLPVQVPGAGTVGLWGETQQPDRPERQPVLAAKAVRGGVLAMPFQNGVQPTIIAGMANIDGETHPLAGVAVAFPLGHHLQLGVEAVYGYLGEKTGSAAWTMNARIFPHVLLQAGAGAFAQPGSTLLTASFGISFTTSDVDFLPVVKTGEPEFRLPTIEEMEREEHQGDEEKSEEERS
jgi:hypothetical protein